MSAIATVTNVDTSNSHFIVKGTIALTGSYPGTPGDTLNFTTASQAAVNPFSSTQVPDDVRIYEAPAAGTSASGLSYVFAPGTTQANGQLQVFSGTSQAGNVTYSSLAIQNLSFTAWIKKFI